MSKPYEKIVRLKVLFLGVWKRINNPDFNSLEFEGIKNEAGRNSFFLSAKKWIELTGAKVLIAKLARSGTARNLKRQLAKDGYSELYELIVELKVYIVEDI